MRERSEGSTRSQTLACGKSFEQELGDLASARGQPGFRRVGERLRPQSEIIADEKSDARVVPTNEPNNSGGSIPALAEAREGRRAAKRNVVQAPAPRTQSRTSASTRLDGIREVAKRSKGTRFTALMHHITPELLTDSFRHPKRAAAAGIDGVTWQDFENGLAERIVALWDAVQSGRYRALPSRRVYIPKPNGKQRPLGIAALEDKIVQQAVVTVLNAIYEADFLGFSYGFRPGRSQRRALDAVWIGLHSSKVNSRLSTK